ncbi:hypothetical protein HanRHA438_Chr16g0785871 [Helianthus annuus]|nr:hypothetical protein HanRHA438_Chr16g0785871 [Helianthus annuus]
MSIDFTFCASYPPRTPRLTYVTITIIVINLIIIIIIVFFFLVFNPIFFIIAILNLVNLNHILLILTFLLINLIRIIITITVLILILHISRLTMKTIRLTTDTIRPVFIHPSHDLRLLFVRITLIILIHIHHTILPYNMSVSQPIRPFLLTVHLSTSRIILFLVLLLFFLFLVIIILIIRLRPLVLIHIHLIQILQRFNQSKHSRSIILNPSNRTLIQIKRNKPQLGQRPQIINLLNPIIRQI